MSRVLWTFLLSSWGVGADQAVLTLQSGHALTDPASEREVDSARIVVVKLRRPATRGSRSALAKLLPAGASIGPYLPNDAYAVLARNEHVRAALSHPDLHSAFDLLPQHKLALELQRPELARPARLLVHLWSMPMRGGVGLSALMARWSREREGSLAVRLLASAAIQHAPNRDERLLVNPAGLTAEEVAQALLQISGLAEVQWIEPHEPISLQMKHAKPVVRGDRWEGGGIDALGLTGRGQVVGVADSGVDFDHCFFADHDRPMTYAPAVPSNESRKVLAVWAIADTGDKTGGHGTHVVGTIAGALPSPTPAVGIGSGLSEHAQAVIGQYDGMAPAAKVLFADVGVNILPDKSDVGAAFGHYLPGLSYVEDATIYEWSHANGARIHSDSWGSSCGGRYSSSSRDADSFIWEHPDFLQVRECPLCCHPTAHLRLPSHCHGWVALSRPRAAARRRLQRRPRSGHDRLPCDVQEWAHHRRLAERTRRLLRVGRRRLRARRPPSR